MRQPAALGRGQRAIVCAGAVQHGAFAITVFRKTAPRKGPPRMPYEGRAGLSAVAAVAADMRLWPVPSDAPPC